MGARLEQSGSGRESLCYCQYSQTQDIIRDILLSQNLNSTISGGRMNISDIYIWIYSRLDIFLEGFDDADNQEEEDEDNGQ